MRVCGAAHSRGIGFGQRVTPRGAVALCLWVLLDCPDLPITLTNPFKGIKSCRNTCLARDRDLSRIIGESISEYTLLLTNVREKRISPFSREVRLAQT